MKDMVYISIKVDLWFDNMPFVKAYAHEFDHIQGDIKTLTKRIVTDQKSCP